jgi:hypothetical protein
MMVFDKRLLSGKTGRPPVGCGLTSVVVSPEAIHLGRPDDGEEGDQIRPDVIEDDEDDQGEYAQAEGAILHGQPFVKTAGAGTSAG